MMMTSTQPKTQSQDSVTQLSLLHFVLHRSTELTGGQLSLLVDLLLVAAATTRFDLI